LSSFHLKIEKHKNALPNGRLRTLPELGIYFGKLNKGQ